MLVHGAAGGVGTAGVQLAAAAGAHVTASVRNERLRDGVARLGAAEVVAHDDFADSGPFDAILELVGAVNMASNLAALERLGRIVVIGVGAGASAEVDLLTLAHKPGDELRCIGRAGADHGQFHPFTPVSVIPSTNAFWAKKNRMITGAMNTNVPAITRFQSTEWVLRKVESPTDRVQ